MREYAVQYSTRAVAPDRHAHASPASAVLTGPAAYPPAVLMHWSAQVAA